MAARLRPNHIEQIRKKIQVSNLVSFLQASALTGKDPAGQVVYAQRIQAAKILLDKAMGDPPTKIAGDPENPLQLKIIHELK